MFDAWPAGIFHPTVPIAAMKIRCGCWIIASTTIPSLIHGFHHVSSRPFIPSSSVPAAAAAVHVLRATWSNGQAVQDYQNFLASGKQEIDLTKDSPSVIVIPNLDYNDGAPVPPLARALVEMGMGDDIVVTPDQTLPETIGPADQREYPIYIILPPDQLEYFLLNLSDSFMARPEDFVFFSGGLQYGNIEDVLKNRGYCRDTMTQVLISGMRIDDATFRVQDVKANLGLSENGETKLAGECTACGKWAGSIAERLERSNVFCRTDFYREWRRKMWERTVFDAVFHVIGAIRDTPTTVADVALYYQQEVSDIVWEISGLLRGWRAITLLYGFEERMFQMGESSGSDQPCTLLTNVYPYVWGNPVLLESKTFVEYLKYGQLEKGLLRGVDLPNKTDDDFLSKMRQGNLRADGVI